MILFDNTIFKFRFKLQLSYLLIPFVFLLYNYLPNTRKYILYHAVCIGIIGIIDCYYAYIENNIGIGIAFISTIIHLLLLIVLINFKKYGRINIISLLETPHFLDTVLTSEKKYELLITFNKIRKEFRNEKLLILFILNFIFLSSDLSLENISFM